VTSDADKKFGRAWGAGCRSAPFSAKKCWRPKWPVGQAAGGYA